MDITKKQKGFAHIQLIIIAVLVIVGIGAVGSYVVFKSKAATNVTTSTNNLVMTQELNPGEPISGSELSLFNSEIEAAAKGASFADNMITVAKAEKARPVCESSDNNGPRIHEYQKYIGPSRCYGTAWCASFVTWVHYKATGKTILKECYVPYMIDKAKKYGLYHLIDSTHKPQRGYIVINKVNKHTGIYVYQKDGDYHTLEGNAGDPNTCVKAVGRPASYWGAYIKP